MSNDDDGLLAQNVLPCGLAPASIASKKGKSSVRMRLGVMVVIMIVRRRFFVAGKQFEGCRHKSTVLDLASDFRFTNPVAHPIFSVGITVIVHLCPINVISFSVNPHG